MSFMYPFTVGHRSSIDLSGRVAWRASVGKPSDRGPPEPVLRAEALPVRQAREQGRAGDGAALRGRHERTEVGTTYDAKLAGLVV